MLAEVRKSELQGCSVREKGSVSQSITGTGVKMFQKKLQGQEGKELFLKTKKILMKICNISHLRSCKLPQKFTSWVSKKTKMPNCIVSFAVPIIVETAMEALPLLVIYLFN